jgi:DNA-binding MarR family transcriptional regulator
MALLNSRAAKLSVFASELSKLYDRMEPGALRLLAHLYAKADPVDGVTLAKELGWITTRVSYNTRLLGEGKEFRSGRVIPSLGLIQIEADPFDQRKKLYSLSKRGRRLVEHLLDIMEAK